MEWIIVIDGFYMQFSLTQRRPIIYIQLNTEFLLFHNFFISPFQYRKTDLIKKMIFFERISFRFFFRFNIYLNAW